MRGASHPQGSGRDARTSRLQFAGPFRGARWVVRSDAPRLVRIATEFLQEQGFEPREDDFESTLRAQGSDWTSTTLEIGDEKRSRRGFWRGILTDDLPFPLPRALQHSIPPTLVVVAARHVASRVAELVVFPHISLRGDPEYAWAAGPRLRMALEGITAAAGAEGAMVSHEFLRGVPNDGAPFSQAVVRDVLGWR